MNFLAFFAATLLLLVGPPVAFGLVVWCCQRLFLYLVGEKSGRTLLLATSVMSVPLRELGHAAMCLLFAHRIEDMRLWEPNAPDGVFGFVEHSYRRRNPLAVLGNWFFALGPVIVGLLVVLVVVLMCFRGALSPFVAEVTALTKNGGDFVSYAKVTFGFLPKMFTESTSGVFAKIIGCILLLSVAFGVSLSPQELWDGAAGLLLFAVPVLVFSAVASLLRENFRTAILTGLGTFAASVTALSLVALLFSLLLTAVGLVFFAIRGIFGLDR